MMDMGWWGYRYRYWRYGWWCPRHPWPPAWARIPYYEPYDPKLEIKYLESIKRNLEAELAELSKRIEELKKSVEERTQRLNERRG